MALLHSHPQFRSPETPNVFRGSEPFNLVHVPQKSQFSTGAAVQAQRGPHPKTTDANPDSTLPGSLLQLKLGASSVMNSIEP